jgi:hypothetical protein
VLLEQRLKIRHILASFVSLASFLSFYERRIQQISLPSELFMRWTPKSFSSIENKTRCCGSAPRNQTFDALSRHAAFGLKRENQAWIFALCQ